MSKDEKYFENLKESHRWRMVKKNPEAYSGQNGYALVKDDKCWTLYFVKGGTMRKILEASLEEKYPFLWAKEHCNKIQNKRRCLGWTEMVIVGTPGSEDTSVNVPDFIKNI